MFGRLQRSRNLSKQPIDQGSSQTTNDPNPSPSSPPLSQPLPTGALHPATLTPVSTTAQSYPHRSLPLPPPLPAYGQSQNRPSPTPSTGDTRLQGLADAALMDVATKDHDIPADRRLPPLGPGLGVRPPHVGQGRFWDEPQSNNGKQRSAVSQTRILGRDEADLQSSSRYNPYPPIPPIPAYRPSKPTPRSQPPLPASAPTSRRSSPTRPQPVSSTAPAALPPNEPSPAQPRPPTARTRSNHRPHPLEGIHLDREYRQPSVDSWEDKAMRVLRLPVIPPAAVSRGSTSSASTSAPQAPRSPPLTAILGKKNPENQRAYVNQSRQPLIDHRNPTPPSTASNTFTPLVSSTIRAIQPNLITSRPTSPSSATITAQPPSAASSSSLRPGRGSDKRPRTTPQSSVWANVASQVAPQDSEGKKIHPPPGGIIPPPPQPSRRISRADSGVRLPLTTDTPLYPEYSTRNTYTDLSSTRKANSEPGSHLDISPAQISPNRSHSVPPVTSPTTSLPSPFLAADITSSLSKRKRPPPSLSLSARPFFSPCPSEDTFESHTAARRASTRPVSAGVRSGSGSTWYSENETTSSSFLTGESDVMPVPVTFPESESQKTLVDSLPGNKGQGSGETRRSKREKGAESAKREDSDVGGEARDGSRGRVITRDGDNHRGKRRLSERRKSQNVDSQKRYREKQSEKYIKVGLFFTFSQCIDNKVADLTDEARS